MPAIEVERLGKRYQIGVVEKYSTLRETIVGACAAPWRRFRQLGGQSTAAETFWALQDVSFQVKPGEVVAFIGGNGAGKSTLLKILSEITEPTTGQVAVQGRMASLLEVGTGFHPELSGRENIYLNGAILGMTRAEIRRRFAEIVEFAEIERFLDTPVKRYSSGMYVRLAFSVAAHLEPEILAVDEVLAVGDAKFQAKCMGKMGGVSSSGRTVLFVSHNMQAVKSLCHTAYQLQGGKIVDSGDAREVVARYLAKASLVGSSREWTAEEAPGTDEIRLRSLRAFSADGAADGLYSSSSDLLLEMTFEANLVHSALCVGFDLVTADGLPVLRTYQTDQQAESWPTVKPGLNRWVCRIPAGLLNGGKYHVQARISLHNLYWIVQEDSAIQFEVVLDHGVSPMWNSLSGHSRFGVVAPIFSWSEATSVGR